MYAKLFVGLFVGFALFSAPVAVFAQAPANTGNPYLPANSGNPYAPANSGNPVCQPGELCNPLKATSICGFLKGLFSAVMMIGIPVATFFIIFAGFKFVVARGRPEKLAEAKLNFMYVALGIAVFLGAWFLAQIIAATIQAVGGPAIMSC